MCYELLTSIDEEGDTYNQGRVGEELLLGERTIKPQIERGCGSGKKNIQAIEESVCEARDWKKNIPMEWQNILCVENKE